MWVRHFISYRGSIAKTSITQHHTLLVEYWLHSRCSCESLGLSNAIGFRCAELQSINDGVIEKILLLTETWQVRAVIAKQVNN